MKKVAVIEGGYSKEKAISIKSAQTVFDNLDRTRFSPTRVLIDENEWTAYDDEGRYPIDKNDFSFIKHSQKNTFDYAFIAIHGTPGEDGKLQGYLDMVWIPYNTSSSAITALTFQKFHCNQFLKNFDINVPEATLIKPNDEINEKEILKKVGLPCFVKPNRAGSSFGISKVSKIDKLEAAIHKAYQEDKEIIIEKSIEGLEVSVGVFNNNKNLVILPITEIVCETEFFDYEAKYLGKSDEITPARISKQEAEKVRQEVKKIYETLNMTGLTRSEFIIQDGIPYFLEINTNPGLSKESIIPKQLKEYGISLTDFFDILIQNALG